MAMEYDVELISLFIQLPILIGKLYRNGQFVGWVIVNKKQDTAERMKRQRYRVTL
jgi:hypothetical protein